MKAAYIETTGMPDVIQYGELPMPELGPGQVRVLVEAVDVNPIDLYIRAGLIPAPLAMPYIIGCDLAGVVDSVGEGASQFKVGDRVWGSNQGMMGRQGTFAEFLAVDEEWLYPIPEGIKAQDAAAVSLVGLTAHLGLFDRARLQAGQTLFVHGGSGGVGSMVIQLAKSAGARVMTTAGNDHKARMCQDFGADEVVNYKTEDVEAAVRGFAPEGVDVWWETLREPDFEWAVPLLAKEGRFIMMAGRDAMPRFPVGPFYVKNCSLLGFAMFNFSPERQRASALELNEMMRQGKLRANIDRVMPLAEAAEAHRLQEANTLGGAGTLAGKIVLTTG